MHINLGEQIKDLWAYASAESRRFHKRVRRRALRRIPIGDHVPTNRYAGWAD